MFKYRFALSSKIFLILISLYFSFALNVKFWSFISENVHIDNLKSAIFALSLPVFIFAALYLFFSLLVWPKIFKPLIIILLILSSCSDYAMYKLGVIIDADMVRNFAETTWREGADFITIRSVLYVLFLGIVPATIILITKIKFNPIKQEIKQRLFYNFIVLTIFAVLIAVSYKEYVSFGRNNRIVRKYINTFNYIYSVGKYYKQKRLSNHAFVILDDKPLKVETLGKNPRLLVLVIGETARAKSFSLYGYERETNPELKKHDIIVYQNAFSCGTATAVSLPCIFAAAERRDFDVVEAKYTQNLLDILQKAGYNVFWNDNDDGCKEVCNRVENIDAKDNNLQPYCFGNYCHDDVLLDDFDKRIKHIKQDTVIVLHTMGSHGPAYFKRYPDKFKRFTPACETPDLQDCSQEEIINAYDNTILYTDYVVAKVVEMLKHYPNLESSMLYASDHGESLGENNIYLHGFPYRFAPDEQKKIPMILWLSPQMQKAKNIDTACLQQNAQKYTYSHDNIYHSVLQLLDIKSSTYKSELDLFVNCIEK